MAAATNAQVQNWADERTRVRAEMARALVNAFTDDMASFESVFINLTSNPNFVDNRTNVPNNLSPADLLAVNAFVGDVQNFIIHHAGWPIIEKACVRPIVGN